MAISFIITTYNITPYIAQCLDSVAEVARPGDEVIVVDDGSSDGTAEVVEQFIQDCGFGDGVGCKPIYLGTNTIGGVGIGANIGLSEANCDTIFFVDGDDWLDVDGFNRARAHWALHPSDILFANYLEYDESAKQTKTPADTRRWQALDRSVPFEDLRLQALAFIAVPWRKFYRRAFVEEHRLRFPEGDFFFEDNPFHWAACMAAESIGFTDQVICYHRVKRPGQTMASTGAELAAFFTHFDTIMDSLPTEAESLRLAAAQWLLGNMSWHIGRLAPSARPQYAAKAAQALSKIDERDWNTLAETEAGKATWLVAERLRRGDIAGQLEIWERADITRRLGNLEKRCRQIENQNRRQEDQGKSIRRALLGQAAAADFEAIIQSREK